MQTVANKISRTARVSRSAVVVRASSQESRRAILAGFVGTVALATSTAALAINETPVDILDDRGARAKGFDIIYEARDETLTQNEREGYTQDRADLKKTVARVMESKNRLDNKMEPLVSKSYWSKAGEELRSQIGYLRFDLNTLAFQKPKAEKKAIFSLTKDLLAKVDKLDFAIRSKDRESALANLTIARAALDAVLAIALV
jgi:hypothetical protein